MMHRATIVGVVALIGVLLVGGGVRAQPPQRFDYPAARAPTTWANTDAGLPHHVVYTDGSVARVALLRLNPAGYGPSYAFGFFCTGHGAAPCADFLLGVAVVYSNSGALITSTTTGVPQVVWSANRGSPLGEGAAAELTPEGDLVLRSANGSAVWSAGTKGRSVAGVTIGSDGNLVLLDGRNATVWQSFDHPTDALLVGQSLGHGARLTANTSAADWRDGRFYLAVEDDALSAYVNATPPQRYYHLGFGETAAGAHATYTNGSLTVSARPGAPSLATIQLPTVVAGTVQYMRLEHDGHLRLYEWRSGSGWAPVFDVLRLFPDGGCAYPTVCGAYGVCTDDTQCSCPDAANFRAVDFRRPNRGCVPTNPPATSCDSSSRGQRAQHRLVSLPGTGYFNDHATSMRAMERVSEEACKKACLDDCACAAAQFYYGRDAGDGFCYLQSEVFSLQTVRTEVVHYNSTMRIKVQAKSARI
ncbi:EP1-like glycoprotein 4 [Triticum dicoccoides]|uniref:EP1-like glycoprotein 4 n=1 Tax=Triticum dicoccoides TaxID=85692 RepID=UPI0018905CEB|nr:EP1-like glycoprotein 4 [Triticum dicoccoides]